MGGASCGSVSGITSRVRAVESADAVEAEAISAVVGPVEDGGRGIAGHRLACPLQPAPVLCTLAFERASEGSAAAFTRCCLITRTYSFGVPVSSFLYLLGLLVT